MLKQLRTVREMCVDRDTSASRHDIVGADAEWYGRNLILASTGRTPQHFGLLGIQLQAVAPYPSGHIANTGGDGVL